jgi:hypothetical protein
MTNKMPRNIWAYDDDQRYWRPYKGTFVSNIPRAEYNNTAMTIKAIEGEMMLAPDASGFDMNDRIIYNMALKRVIKMLEKI